MRIARFFFQSIASTHKEGYKFIAFFLFVGLFSFFISDFLGWVFLLLTVFCIAFFRDPARVIATDEEIILSPADGIITSIKEAEWPEQLQGESQKTICISIFMDIFNCHVNRTPISGVLEQKHYVKGKFLSADLDKASENNERAIYLIAAKEHKCVVVQIAGLVARRIVSFVDEGNFLDQGQRLGIIRFGSRVDVYLPALIQAKVIVGQKSVAGETILADLVGDNQKIRHGRLE